MRQLSACMLLLAAPWFPSIGHAWIFNMTPGVSEISQSVYGLHMTIFIICVVIGVIVFGFMFYSIIMHRKSRGVKPAPFHENALVEIIWTTIPFIILIVMSIPATKTLIKIYNSEDSDIDIKITGYQWKWQYEYLGEDISFFSHLKTSKGQIYNIRKKDINYLLDVDNALVIPIGKKVRFLVTGADVIHSWYVPAFSIKRDAIPGFINEAWTRATKTGFYRGQCAELCGKDHAFMPIVVEVKTEDEYKTWLAEKKEEARKEKELTSKEWTKKELMVRGKIAYEKNCAQCHGSGGAGMPPIFPALTGSAIASKKEGLKAHIDIVLYGKTGTAMQAFIKQLSLVDIAAVITYERNSLGNNVGNIVTPKELDNYIKTDNLPKNDE